MTYSSKAIANYFLELAKDSEELLTPMKLQKLIYFAHGWHLAIYDEPLISETVEAWRFGPVVPSIYHEFKNYGSGTISGFATEFDLNDDDDSLSLTSYIPTINQNDGKVIALLKKIWEIYGKYSGITLSNLTHKDDSPWAKVWSISTPKGTDIPANEIKKYFQELAPA